MTDISRKYQRSNVTAEAAKGRSLVDLIDEVTQGNSSLSGGFRGRRHTLLFSIGVNEKDADRILEFLEAFQNAVSGSIEFSEQIRQSSLSDRSRHLSAAALLAELESLMDQNERPQADVFVELMTDLSDAARQRVTDLCGNAQSRFDAVIRHFRDVAQADPEALRRWIEEMNSDARKTVTARMKIGSIRSEP